MTDKEFWEDDPQLYWSYLILYKKKMEFENEQLRYSCWLQGKMNCIAYSVAMANAFGKNKKVEFFYIIQHNSLFVKANCARQLISTGYDCCKDT